MTTLTTRRAGPSASSPQPAFTPNAPEASALFRALGNEGRLTILTHLREGPLTVRELENLTGIPQPMVSSHLARLRFEGLVSFRKVGRSSVYSLEDATARQLLDALDDVFCTGLRAHLE